MRRAAILMALVACSSSSKTTELADDARAGEVLAARGEVHAVLAGNSRVLSAGAVIYAGDELRTGADAELRVKLDHNGAVLTLGGDKILALRQSAAWRAEKAVAGVLERGGDGDETTAAGRHAEKSAADTAATAPGSPVPAAEPADSPDEPAAEAMPMAEPETVTEEQELPRRAAMEESRRAAEEKARAAEMEARLRAEEARLRLESESVKKKQSARSKKTKGGGSGGKLRSSCDPADPLCGLDAESDGVIARDSADLTPLQVATVLRGLAQPFKACVAKHGAGSLTVKVTVGASGTPTSVEAVGVTSPPLAECVVAVVKGARFPAAGSFEHKIDLQAP